MIRFDVNEEAGIQWVAEGSGGGGVGGETHKTGGCVVLVHQLCIPRGVPSGNHTLLYANLPALTRL